MSNMKKFAPLAVMGGLLGLVALLAGSKKSSASPAGPGGGPGGGPRPAPGPGPRPQPGGYPVEFGPPPAGAPMRNNVPFFGPDDLPLATAQSVATTDRYTANTSLIKAFQREAGGLAIDGKYGPATRAELSKYIVNAPPSHY